MHIHQWGGVIFYGKLSVGLIRWLLRHLHTANPYHHLCLLPTTSILGLRGGVHMPSLTMGPGTLSTLLLYLQHIIGAQYMYTWSDQLQA